MTFFVVRNLAHKSRPGGREVVVAACLFGQLLFFPGDPAAGVRDAAPSATPAPGEPVPPPVHPPEILVAPMPPTPAPGKGRLAWVIAGNRRWCTFPDDRLVKPPGRPGQPEDKNEIFTFGYEFSISAVKRGNAASPLMLFESPLYRTAEWRLAAKVGQIRSTGRVGPAIGTPGEGPSRARPNPKTPDSLVPYWNESYRCVTFPARLDFDLEPGTYDVYIAFDLLNREGGWVHRMSSYLTDVPIEAARSTLLDGTINLSAGSERQVELESSTLQRETSPSAGAGP